MIKADGFDDAILGTDYASGRIIYSMSKMIEIELKATEMDPDEIDPEDDPFTEVVDHLSFNVWGAYVGEMTPIYLNDLNDVQDILDEFKDGGE